MKLGLRLSIDRAIRGIAVGGPARWRPTSLFSAGEQGVWYDPSDLSTLYQDSAGTTPVTAVEQPVGLMLDKRLGLARGAQLIANGDFSGGSTGWLTTGGNTTTFTGGVCRTVGAANSGPYQDIVTSAGVAYELTFSATIATGTLNASAYDGAGFGSMLASTGGSAVARRLQFVALSAVTRIYFPCYSTPDITIDDVSVRSLAGNHATQATAGARPVLSARVNRLTKSDQFDDAAWGKAGCTVVANADGIADRLTLTAASSAYKSLQHSDGLVAPATGRFFCTVKVKNDGAGFATIVVTGNNGRATFNLATAAVTVWAGTNVVATVSEADGDGYRTISFAGDSNGTGNFWLGAHEVMADPSNPFTSSASASILVKDAQVSTTATRYQRVTTASDYDSVGFPRYLKFDGVDDFMATPFTPTTYPLTLVAGINASTAVAGGVLSVATSDASYKQLSTTTSAGANMAQDRNAVTITAQSGSAAGAHVLIGELGVASTNLYVNNVAVTSVANTNVFGTPTTLFVGKSRPAGLFFTGNFHVGVVLTRGISANERASLKTYTNSKTGAY